MNTIPQTKFIHPNFKAVKVAETSTVIGRMQNHIDIYKLGNEDKNFLQKLAIKTNFKDLMPELPETASTRWQEILYYCITSAFDKKNTTYIAMNNNKPCGIMTYYSKASSLFLDGICTIPSRNKKIPYTGQSLFLELFKIAEAAKAKSIQLDAVQNGPFDVVSKYEELGFKKDPTSTPYTRMVCSKYKIKEQLKELSSIISYIKSNSSEKINLEHTLD